MPGWIPWCEDKEREHLPKTATATKNKQKHALLQNFPISTASPSAASLTDTTRSTTAATSLEHPQPKKSFWNHIYLKRPITLFEDFLTMGACLSAGGGGMLIEGPDGDEQDFHNRFIQDRVLGEGEFGVVTLVHDMQADESDNTMACKTLRKGVVFKDNTLYSPMKPDVLQCEVNVLRTLNGEHFCMALNGVYETKRLIYMVTEYCGGGEMMEYVSKQEEDLRTDDVSRIAFQMLDAVNHCARHNIIHRDIKPENVMFQHPTPGSDLRLIDFGSGTNKVVEGNHTTFAGSAFYISPEMFQRTYTQKTDVWSVGVTLYVLVAGYPADVLQTAFNMLQKQSRALRNLPGFPDDMPDSFVEVLEEMLVYRHKKRKTAGELLEYEFVQFHKAAFTVEQIAMEALQDAANGGPDGSKRTKTRTQSVSLRGSVGRHTLFLDYQKYERSLTTLLATLLDKKELLELTKALDQELESRQKYSKDGDGNLKIVSMETNLNVMSIHDLKKMLEAQKHEQVLSMVTKLPGSSNYNTFAYDVSLLKDFAQGEEADDSGASRSVRSRRQNRVSKRRGSAGGNSSLRGSFRGSFRGASIFSRNRNAPDMFDSSVHSTGSLRGRKNNTNPGEWNPKN